MRHVLSATVQNVPGVLAHVSGMLASRGYNIDSLAVGETEDRGFSRMTFVLRGDDRVLDQVRRQLEKIVTVVRVDDISSRNYVERDLMLIKVAAIAGAARTEVKELAEVFRGRIVDVAADGVVVPMQCEYFALEGLSDLVNTIKQVHANLNPNLKIIGLLRVMFDARVTLQQQVSEQLMTHFGNKVFKTIIPRNVRLAEAPSFGLPGVIFDKSARGAQAYIEFGGEMVERIKTM